MSYIKTSFLLLLVFCITTILEAQNCDCTILEVENNTVTPCNLVIGNTVNVSSVTQFKNAINQANANGGNMTILIADGTYQVASTSSYPYITASNIVIRSLSGNRDAVTLTGGGMVNVAPNTENGISCIGDNITIADLTIRDVGNHGISVNGDNLMVHNVKIQNAFEQLIKGTTGGGGSDNSTVQCSLLEYPGGVGPQFYIGGLDIHEGDNWLVSDNIFRNIASPSGSLAEHAVHFWDFSTNNTVERNAIYNCDRGIGFGLGSSPNDGGIIRNNMIYNDGTGLFDDVGISLETSPNTKVYNNTIYIEYSNAIEYRFASTNNVEITNNLTNKAIQSRNSGQATLTSNYTNAQANWFQDITTGNLRTPSIINDITDQGITIPTDITMDIDKTPRPQGSGLDIGAFEFNNTLSVDDFESNTNTISVFPNPSSSSFTVKSKSNSIYNISIYNILNQRIISYKNKNLTSGLIINSSQWKTGIYFCRISDFDKYNKMVKIIVSR